MDILNKFSDDVTEIDISHKNIIGSPDFSRFTKLKKLNCNFNCLFGISNKLNLIFSMELGKLFRDWLKLLPKVKCVILLGKLFTD